MRQTTVPSRIRSRQLRLGPRRCRVVPTRTCQTLLGRKHVRRGSQQPAASLPVCAGHPAAVDGAVGAEMPSQAFRLGWAVLAIRRILHGCLRQGCQRPACASGRVGGCSPAPASLMEKRWRLPGPWGSWMTTASSSRTAGRSGRCGTAFAGSRRQLPEAFAARAYCCLPMPWRCAPRQGAAGPDATARRKRPTSRLAAMFSRRNQGRGRCGCQGTALAPVVPSQALAAYNQRREEAGHMAGTVATVQLARL